MVEEFDFKELTSSNEVAGDLNVGFGRSRITARMIVLCGHPSNVQCLGCGALVGLVLWTKGVL